MHLLMCVLDTAMATGMIMTGYNRAAPPCLLSTILESARCALPALIVAGCACSACKLGLAQLVQQLLEEEGHDVNSTTEGTQLTPLHIASKHGHEHIVRLLLQQPGVDVNAQTAPDVQVSIVECQAAVLMMSWHDNF
jgi:hypothetical protein